MLHINSEVCTGCGACIDACPNGTIHLAANKAEIDAENCSDCQVCADACPVGAITVAALPVPRPREQGRLVPAARVSRTPAPTSERRWAPWAGTVLAWVGREVVPRLADELIAALERRWQHPTSVPVAPRQLIAPPTTYGPARPYHRRRRRRRA